MKTKLLLLTLLLLFTSNYVTANELEEKKINKLTTTSIPDADFEQELINLGYDTGTPNGTVPTANISGVTSLTLNYLGIKKLDGIEDFLALEKLEFYGQDPLLTSVNLSANINLKHVDIEGFPNLASLDLTGLTNIETLVLYKGAFTSLDFSGLTGLEILNVLNMDQLISLNIQNGANINIHNISIKRNPNLFCIKADSNVPAKGLSAWTGRVDSQNVFDDSCAQRVTYVPDDNFETFLEANSMGNGITNDDKVFTNNINAVTNLNISSLSISDLTGIEDFAALIELNATMNTISSINVSQNTTLEKLILNNNTLTSIDVSQNTTLKQLWVRQNNLKFIDVSKNTNLEWFICSRNTIENLDLSTNTLLGFIEIHTNDLHTLNLKNVSPASLSFDAQLNSNLACIEVDNPTTWTTVFSSQIDNTASFSSNCSYPETSVPDAAFENYLETHDRNGNTVSLGDVTSMGNGTANDGKVYTHRINTVKLLDVSNVGLSVLTGLEDFRDLETFGAFGGNSGLTSADFSNNIKLKRITFTFNSAATNVIFGNLPDVTWVQLGYNNISNIDISGLTKLEHFNALGDKLTSLVTSNNPDLKILSLAGSQLTSIDVSNNLKLENLTLGSNQITSLNVSANLDLTHIDVSGNQIKHLDLSNNSKLINFTANNNILETLNLKNGNNTILPGSYGVGFSNFPFDIRNNPNLTCIEVSDLAFATANWTAIDGQHVFNTSCVNSVTYVPDDNFENYLETHDANGTVVALGDATSMGNGIANDDYVFTNRINAVAILRVNNLSISDMTGIEDFLSLQVLDATSNNISTINVTSLVSMYQLAIDFNPITTIDVTQNSNLRILEVVNTGLINLDVTSNSVLEILKIDNTPLTMVDTSQNPSLKTFSAEVVPLSQVDFTNNTILEYLELRDNSLTSLDISNNLLLQIFVLTGSPLTAIDLSQHTKLIEVRLNNNASLAQLNVKNGFNVNIPTFSFDITNNPSLTCIEVDDANYSSTNWTNIDGQHVFNTTCSSQAFTLIPDPNFEQRLIALSIDTDGIVNGQVFTADINTITNLNVNNSNISDLTGIEDFIALEELICWGNSIQNVDVSNNVALKKINISGNQLSSINIDNNINLEYLDVGSNQFNNIDISKNTLLEVFVCNNNQFTSLNITSNINLNYLFAGSNSISIIDLSQNVNLVDIRLHFNQITSIDLTNLTKLEKLSIDVSTNSLLDLLDISKNMITNIDLSNNIVLNNLNLFDNDLEKVDIRNGNNSAITTFDARLNPRLVCVAVSDVSYFNTNFGQNSYTIDSQTTYSANCSSVWAVMTNTATTTALLAVSGLDVDMDGEITIAEAAAFTGTLDLSGSGITDVEGLQAFTGITTLDVSSNGITDLSPLTSSTFSVIAKTSGKTKTIEKTTAMALEEIVLSDNNFDVIDVSSLGNLKVVKLNNNPNLITVNLKNGNNAAITKFNSSNTPNLSCILVDDVNAGYLSTWTKDTKSVFVADEADCRARVLSINSVELSNNISLYPNPVNDILQINISNNIEIQNIEIYNVIGRRILETKLKEINLSQFNAGIYLLKIKTSKGVVSKKVIKQ